MQAPLGIILHTEQVTEEMVSIIHQYIPVKVQEDGSKVYMPIPFGGGFYHCKSFNQELQVKKKQPYKNLHHSVLIGMQSQFYGD